MAVGTVSDSVAAELARSAEAAVATNVTLDARLDVSGGLRGGITGDSVDYAFDFFGLRFVKIL